MEVKFAKLLNENGVTAEQTTAKIKELIETFNEAWEEYQEKIEEVENASEDEQESLVEEIQQFESDLSEADTEIYKKIQSWLKNKDTWEANAQRMAQGRANKNAQKGNSTPTPTPTSVNTSANSNANINPEPNVTAQQPITEQKEEKKSSGIWWLAGFVAIVTLGAVALKNK